MQSVRVQFSNARGQQLSGLIDWPAQGPSGTTAMALFAHCFTCSKNLKAVSRITEALTEVGIGVLRFDFTGLGSSEGDFADTSFSTNVADLIAAADWLSTNHGAPQLLVGHSLGGTAVLHAAGQLASVRAVATIGAPADASHVRHLFADREADIRAAGRAEVILGGRAFELDAEFLDDIERQPPVDHVRRLRKALLILHAPLDDTVEIDNASRLFSHALHPKSFISLDGADHLLTRSEDARWAGESIAAWAQHYLETTNESRDTPAPGHQVATTHQGSFTTTIQSDQHTLIADEPAGVGGRDLGPSPVALLGAALASCTTMTLQMYARHKKLPLESVTVDVSQQKQETPDGQMTVFTRRIALHGPLDDAVRTRLLEIADRCPVHRSLHGPVRVDNVLVANGPASQTAAR